MLLQIRKTSSKVNNETSSLTDILFSQREENNKYLHNLNRRSFCIDEKFQAEIPEVLTLEERKEYEATVEADMQVWGPDLADVETFLKFARGKMNYSLEQAFGLLFWCQHDIERATLQLKNFKPSPDKWNKDEKLVFDQGHQIYGKELREFQKMLPRKSLKEIVEYYYLWKEQSLKKPKEFYMIVDSDIESMKSTKRFKVLPNIRH